MIDNLTINFESNGITHTLDVPTKDENSEMVIDNLKDEFAYETNSWISVNDRLPEMYREVITLDDEGRISFAHIVDTTTTTHYDGWNIPNVEYWMPFNNPLED